MNNDMTKLYDVFKKINNVGWIKSKRNDDSGVGYTFEQLISKKEENLPFPDFNMIEIKTHRKSSNDMIRMFSVNPDGDFLFPIERILKILGYPDKKCPQCKVFNVSVNSRNFRFIGYYKKCIIKVDRLNEKIYLLALDNNNNDMHVDISWTFQLLKERLYMKLQILALIEAESKRINNYEYFYYTDINFYILKKFDKFIDLIEDGNIFISFKIGIFRTGKRAGQTHNRGIDFLISKSDIEKLYYKVKKY